MTTRNSQLLIKVQDGSVLRRARVQLQLRVTEGDAPLMPMMDARMLAAIALAETHARMLACVSEVDRETQASMRAAAGDCAAAAACETESLLSQLRAHVCALLSVTRWDAMSLHTYSFHHRPRRSRPRPSRCRCNSSAHCWQWPGACSLPLGCPHASQWQCAHGQHYGQTFHSLAAALCVWRG